MKMIWHIFAGDMRRLLSNVIAGIVVVGLVLVPPLYAWFTTLGFWDPYENTGNLKVAVASMDEGYASDLIPTRINAGEQVVSALRANDQFDWQFVDEQEALDGVRSGQYYAAMIIPKSFSADLMTVFSDKTTEAKIVYYDNEKENAIAQRVTSTGATTLQETIDETFAETVANVALGTTSSLTSFMSGEGILAYARSLDTSLSEAVGELSAASDQARAYADLMGSTGGLIKASGALLEETAKAPDATTPLIADGRDDISDGKDALTSAADSSDKALAAASSAYDSVSQAAESAFATMKDDPAQARKMLADCQSDVEELAQAYTTMRDALSAADPDSPALPAINRAIAEMGTLASSLAAAQDAIGTDAASLDKAREKALDSIAQARKALATSQDTYHDQLKGELADLSANLEKVGRDAEGLADSLKSTAQSLGDSTETLSASLDSAEAALRKTSDTLRTATDQLAQARSDLSRALESGDVDEVRRIIGNNPAALAKFLAAPTTLERHEVYPMANNGSAMSPFYTSLCLWIGAIFMVALMAVQVSPERIAELKQKFGRAPTQAEQYLGRYGVFCVLGLLQAIIVGLGNVFFLGVECEHFWLYMAACCLTSVAFTNLVYTLTVSFGNIGKALAIIGLVLQLGGAGGLMPVQMLSAPLFQEIYPWLPFAHSMPALEGAMAGIYGDHYAIQMALIAAILVPSLILGLVLRRPVIRLNDWVLRKLDETKFL